MMEIAAAAMAQKKRNEKKTFFGHVTAVDSIVKGVHHNSRKSGISKKSSRKRGKKGSRNSSNGQNGTGTKSQSESESQTMTNQQETAKENRRKERINKENDRNKARYKGCTVTKKKTNNEGPKLYTEEEEEEEECFQSSAKSRSETSQSSSSSEEDFASLGSRRSPQNKNQRIDNGRNKRTNKPGELLPMFRVLNLRGKALDRECASMAKKLQSDREELLSKSNNAKDNKLINNNICPDYAFKLKLLRAKQEERESPSLHPF